MGLNNLKVSPRLYRDIVSKRSLTDEFSLRYDKRLAVLIPCVNRDAHLEALLPELRAALDSQQLNYQIFVLDQTDDTPFNKGALFNAGATIAGDTFDYYSLHDVDMVPTDCSYGYPSAPFRPFGTILTSAGQRVFSSIYWGGIVTVSREHFQAVNGFSNKFWRWGKEDDNFLLRLLTHALNPVIDSLGTVTEMDNSSNRFTVGNPDEPDNKIQEAKRLRNINRAYQVKVARGIIPPSAEGLTTIAYELVERLDLPTHTRLKLSFRSLA